MTRTSKTLRRLCVPGLAAATLAAASPFIGFGATAALAQTAPLVPSRIIVNDCPDATSTTTTATNNQGTVAPVVSTAPGADPCKTQAQTGQVKTLTFTEVNVDGAPVPNRNLLFTLSSSTANSTAAFTATQPVGSAGTNTPGTVRCLTSASGQCSVTLISSAPSAASVLVEDEALKTANPLVNNARANQVSNTENIDFRNGSTAPAVLSRTDRVVVAPEGAAFNIATPGRPAELTYKVFDSGTGDASAPVLGAALTLTVNRAAFFTNNCQKGRTNTTTPPTGRLVPPTYLNCTFAPAPVAGAQAGALNSLGQTLNVVTDQNGEFTVTVAEGRDAAFDDSGAVVVTLTATNPDATNFSTGTGSDGVGVTQARDETFLSVAPLNGASTTITPVDGRTLSNTSTNDVQDRTLAADQGDPTPGARTFVLRLRDQFGNLTASGVGSGAAQDLLRLNKTGVGSLYRCVFVTADNICGGDDLSPVTGNPGTADQTETSLQGSFLNRTATQIRGQARQERFQIRATNRSTGAIEQGLAKLEARWAAPRTTYTFSVGTSPRLISFDQTAKSNVLIDTVTLDFYTPIPGVTIAQTPNQATVPVNTVVNEQATVRDQRNQAIRNSFVTFLRSGTSNDCTSSADNGTGFGRATTPTNAQGQVSFIFSCSTASSQTVTAVATDASNNELARGARNVSFSGSGASATPTATMSPTATPTATVSPSPSSSPTTPAACATPATLTFERDTIIATGSSGVTVTAPANSIVDLYAYTRPSSTYRVVRSAEVGTNGTAEFRIVPPANTRLYAQVRGCTANIVRDSKVLNVRTALSLFAVRNSSRNYTFSGDSLPARQGGLIVSLYRVTASGSQILTAQTRASASNGNWVINRRFTGEGRFGFVVRTGQDLQNAPGASNVRPTLIF